MPGEQAFINVRPRFRVDGQLDENLGEAVLDAVAHLPGNGSAHAEVRLLNWGRDGSGEASFRLQTLRLGSRFEILFSAEHETAQFSGEITAIEERYGDGAPQLVLLAEDKLHQLARRRRSRIFESQTPDAVVSSLASEVGLSADAAISNAQATWHQLNESGLAFLMRILRPFGVPLRLDGNALRARAEEVDADPLAVDPQENATRVRLIADLNHQVESSAVAGFDLAADQGTQASVRSLDNAPPGQTASQLLGSLGWEREEAYAHPFALTQGLADAYAAGAFKPTAQRFLHGDIACRGLPLLKPGKELDLSGVSDRLRGRYRVVHCRHAYHATLGYETEARVERPDWSA